MILGVGCGPWNFVLGILKIVRRASGGGACVALTKIGATLRLRVTTNIEIDAAPGGTNIDGTDGGGSGAEWRRGTSGGGDAFARR